MPQTSTHSHTDGEIKQNNDILSSINYLLSRFKTKISKRKEHNCLGPSAKLLILFILLFRWAKIQSLIWTFKLSYFRLSLWPSFLQFILNFSFISYPLFLKIDSCSTSPDPQKSCCSPS